MTKNTWKIMEPTKKILIDVCTESVKLCGRWIHHIAQPGHYCWLSIFSKLSDYFYVKQASPLSSYRNITRNDLKQCQLCVWLIKLSCSWCLCFEFKARPNTMICGAGARLSISHLSLAMGIFISIFAAPWYAHTVSHSRENSIQ